MVRAQIPATLSASGRRVFYVEVLRTLESAHSHKKTWREEEGLVGGERMSGWNKATQLECE
jgi:hypothetical protein